MVMRLRGRPPHPDWPTKYPNECARDVIKCPVRAINDVENYLLGIIEREPPPLMSTTLVRRHFEQSFVERNFCIRRTDSEVEEDVEVTYPAAWVPPQVKCAKK